MPPTSSGSSSALLAITLDPFCKPWKKLRGVLEEARLRGFEIVVALDDRTCAACFAEFYRLDIPVATFRSPGYCEAAFRFAVRATRDFVLRIDDDETPSEPLWDFATRPPQPARFAIPVMPIIGDQLWRPDVGLQERLFWREGWRWVGGFAGHSESGAPALVIERNPGVLIWHHLLDAPRDERERKAARYEAIAHGAHRTRLIYEEHPEALVPIPEHLTRYLPQEV